MNNRYMILENKLCKELELLEEKYRTGAEMSEGDLRKIDLLTHAMKSLATFTAMKGSEMPPENYSSYGMGNSYNSYADPYMRGMRSRDMGPDMSGHYPFPYPEERRW